MENLKAKVSCDICYIQKKKTQKMNIYDINFLEIYKKKFKLI